MLPFGYPAIHTAEHPRRANSVRDFARGLEEYRNYFQEVAEFPQIGACERFVEQRIFGLSYLENQIHRKDEDIRTAMRQFNKPRQPPLDEASQAVADEQFRLQLDSMVRSLNADLELHGRLFNQTRMMAMAISSSSRSRKSLYNEHLSKAQNGRAPNGQDIARYEADSAPTFFAAVAHEEMDPIEQLLAFLCIAPLFDYIIWPFEKLLYIIFKRGNARSKHRDRSLAADTISVIAKPVVSVLATSSLAAAVSVLNSIGDAKLKIVVMTLFGEGFALSASFFGRDSMAMLQLITAYFQAMIFFVANSN